MFQINLTLILKCNKVFLSLTNKNSFHASLPSREYFIIFLPAFWLCCLLSEFLFRRLLCLLFVDWRCSALTFWLSDKMPLPPHPDGVQMIRTMIGKHNNLLKTISHNSESQATSPLVCAVQPLIQQDCSPKNSSICRQLRCLMMGHNFIHIGQLCTSRLHLVQCQCRKFPIDIIHFSNKCPCLLASCLHQKWDCVSLCRWTSAVCDHLEPAFEQISESCIIKDDQSWKEPLSFMAV